MTEYDKRRCYLQREREREREYVYLALDVGVEEGGVNVSMEQLFWGRSPYSRTT